MAMLNNQRVYGVIMYYLYMLAYAGSSNPNVLMTIQNHTCAGNGKYMAC